jgi:hypothetical protein
MLLKVIFVLLFGFFSDIVYVFTHRAIVNNKPLKATLWSMVLGSMSLFGFINVYDNHWLAIPWILSGGIGFYLGMILDNKYSKNE